MTIALRCFAAAREAAGRANDTFAAADAPTLGAVLALACDRYGEEFARVLATARVWVNGDEAERGTETPLRDGDEVAVLPPVSGGMGDEARTESAE